MLHGGKRIPHDGLRCCGVPVQQERGQPDHYAVVLIRTQQLHVLGVGERAAERCERGNQLLLAWFFSRLLVLAHGTWPGRSRRAAARRPSSSTAET